MAMASFKIYGLDKYAMMLSRLRDESTDISQKAIYKGAGIVADEVSRQVGALPEDEERYLRGREYYAGVPKNQKDDLLKGIGIAKMERNEVGDLNTKIGFAGYGSKPTRAYPKGLPNAMVARAIASGGSTRKKHPFMRKAVNVSRKKAVEGMGEVVEEEIRKIME